MGDRDEWTQQRWWDEAARLLTEAERSNNIGHRMRIARQVDLIFDEAGFPDWSSRVTRLEDDTAHMERMQSSW